MQDCRRCSKKKSLSASDEWWSVSLKKVQFDTKVLATAIALMSGASAAVEESLTLEGFEEELAWLQEETMVVSASRVSESLKKTAASVTVIEGETIRDMGARNLKEALRIVPGLGISQSNVWVDKIDVRGIQDWFSKKVLIMIDSHPMDVDLINGGSTTLSDRMPLENVERIEVIRGPASALYGANAFSALINVITKQPGEEGSVITQRGGSDGEQDTDLQVRGKWGEVNAALHVNLHKDNGDDVPVASDAASNAGNTNPWNDSWLVDLNLQYEGASLRLMSQDRKDGPRFGIVHILNERDQAHLGHSFVELGYQWDPSEDLQLKSRLWHDDFFFDNFWDAYGAVGNTMQSGVTTTKTGLELLGDYHLNEQHRVVGGVFAEKQRSFDITYFFNGADISAPSTSWADPGERKLWALFAEDLWDVRDDLRLTLGARYDHYSDFGGVLNPRGGLNWIVDNQLTVRAMYGEGFRAPTFGELFNKNNSVVNGNPNLKPETTETVELGVLLDPRKDLHLAATLFKTEIQDSIALGSGAIYQNNSASKTRGLELEGKLDLYRGSYLAANYTWQDSEDDSGVELADVPDHRANLMFNHRLNREFNLFLDANFKGAVTRASSDSRSEVGGYMVLNASLHGRNFTGPWQGVSLTATVKNLLDKESYDPASTALQEDYRNSPRAFFVELAYDF